MSDATRARELLDMIDVATLGLERVLSSLLRASDGAADDEKRALLMDAIELTSDRDEAGWHEWVDCLLKEGPQSPGLAEISPFLPEELPEPEGLEDIALDQARRFKDLALDFLLSDNHPDVAKSTAFQMDGRAIELEVWAGLPQRQPAVMPYQPPEWLDEFEWDEDGVLKGWVVDEETGDAVPVDAEEKESAKNPIEALVDDMNGRFCAVLDGGGFSVFMRDQDPAFGRPF